MTDTRTHARTHAHTHAHTHYETDKDRNNIATQNTNTAPSFLKINGRLRGEPCASTLGLVHLE